MANSKYHRRGLRLYAATAVATGLAALSMAFAPAVYANSSGGYSSLFSGQLIDLLQEAAQVEAGSALPEQRSLYSLQDSPLVVAGKIDRPISPGERVQFQIRAQKRWKRIESAKVLRKSGEYKLRVSLSGAAKYRYRVALASEATSSAQISTSSPVMTGNLTVYRPVLATWFGPGFYGSKMACGQVLTEDIVAVAHPTLPCGTSIEIFANGRVLRTQVLDKCSCNIDLTAGAAKAIGMNSTISIGVRTVRKR